MLCCWFDAMGTPGVAGVGWGIPRYPITQHPQLQDSASNQPKNDPTGIPRMPRGRKEASQWYSTPQNSPSLKFEPPLDTIQQTW